jgi:hypothetical protein
VTDFGSSHPWPEGLREHLDGLRQGSVIQDIGLIFKSAGHSPLWAGTREEIDFAGGTVAAIKELSIDKAMVVTQSCDLMKRYEGKLCLVP